MRAYNEKKCFRVIIVIPLLPGFQVLIVPSISCKFESWLICSFYTEWNFNRGVWMMVVQHLWEPSCIGSIEQFSEDLIQSCIISLIFLVLKYMITFLSMALELMVNSLMVVLWPPVRYFLAPIVALHLKPLVNNTTPYQLFANSAYMHFFPTTSPYSCHTSLVVAGICSQ